MKKSIVITGATGFLGRNLAVHFLEQGYEVYAVVRSGSNYQNSLPEHPQLRIVFSEMSHIMEDIGQIQSADAWFHFAWGGVNRQEIDSSVVQKENITGSINCVRAANAIGCKVFMDAGSRVEYGVTNGRMIESMECNPVNEYGKAKMEFFRKAEVLCKDFGMTYYHLRFFSVYGYGDHPWSVISTLIGQLTRGEDVSLSACRHLWNFMYIQDAVEAIYQLYGNIDQEGSTAIINIASQDTRPLRDFVEEVKSIIGGQGSLNYGTFVQAKEGALSIQPEIAVLKQLTKGKWKERYSFKKGILEILEKESEYKVENENN